jgi:glycosyltransferase involved in cell wall biosynthesis
MERLVNEGLPLVSIVTPSFNQAAYLEAAIQSVLGQDYPRLEYVIVDGGSTDGSLDIVRRYAERLTHWSSEPDSGQTEAINKGFARATGDILAWLNSDDVYYPGAVREAVAFLQAHPEVGMVYGDAEFINESGKAVGRFPARQTSQARLRRGYVHIPQQASFFRASLWKMVAPLDPAFYFAMDYDLWVRIAGLAQLHYRPGAWAGFRLHADAKTSTAADRCWPEMLRVHRREGGSYLSALYAKYLIRRVLEPILPYRLHARLWLHRVGSRWRER